MRASGIVVLAALVLAGSAAAQDMQFDQPSDMVSTLVVKARAPGPAWWKLTKGKATVWIIGDIDMIPADQVWSDSTLRRRVLASRSLLLFTYTSSKREIEDYRRNGLADISDPLPLADRIPALDLRRLATIGSTDNCTSHFSFTGRSPSAPIELTTRQPRTVMAAMCILGRADRLNGPMIQHPAHTAAGVAAAASRVKIRATAIGDAIADQRAAISMPQSDQLTCLENSLDLLAWLGRGGKARLRAQRAQAWAEGDVPAVMAPDFKTICPAPAAVAKRNAKGVSDMAAGLAAALNRPEQTVAVVDLYALLAQGGVLDRLSAIKGVTVTPPDSAG
jgi:hypothetical protein